MAEPHNYSLDIDGPLFRQQREVLARITDIVRCEARYKPLPGDGDLLDGLMELVDAIADQAHDRYRIDCLLEGSSHVPP